MGGPGGGGMGGGGGMPPMKVMVRWESAQPLYDATKRQRAPRTDEFYILSVTGLRMMGGGRGGMGKGGEGQPDPAERQKAMLARLKESAAIERKGKDPIHPDMADSVNSARGSVIMMAFSRKAQPISLEDKEVLFHAKMGPMEIKAKFPLKDMVYGGQLAL